MKSICAVVCLGGIVVLFFSEIVHRLETEIAFAQPSWQDSSKGAPEQKKTSPGFEDDQSSMCLSATQQAKLIASIVEAYSRRLAACAVSNPSFRDDCSADFTRVVKSYNEYQFAISSVRNYCR